MSTPDLTPRPQAIGQKLTYCHSYKDFYKDGYAAFECTGGYFRINKNLGRYIHVYFGGYLRGDGEDRDTPYMEIGKCSPF